jgi:hypothetical protein
MNDLSPKWKIEYDPIFGPGYSWIAYRINTRMNEMIVMCATWRHAKDFCLRHIPDLRRGLKYPPTCEGWKAIPCRENSNLYDLVKTDSRDQVSK